MAGRKKKEAPPEQDYTGLQNYYKSRPTIEDLFVRTLRVLHEQLARLEKDMFQADNLGFNPDKARLSKELSTAVTSCGQMFFKIQDMAKQATDRMTTDEKIEAVTDMIRDFGRNNRYKFWAAMRTLEHELNEEDKLSGAPEAPRSEPE